MINQALREDGPLEAALVINTWTTNNKGIAWIMTTKGCNIKSLSYRTEKEILYKITMI